jgi:hypothetical protein
MCAVAAGWTSGGCLAAAEQPAAGVAAAAVSMRSIDATWPAPPGEESWTFVEDLKKPLPLVLFWKEGSSPQPGQVDLRGGLAVKRAFPDEKGVLKTAYADLQGFLAFAKLAGESGIPVTTEKVATAVPEAYSIEISSSGIRLLAGDAEGIRRAIFHLEEMIAAAEGPFLSPGVTSKKPWLKHRITRCFFGPIKRPPLNRDELMDDVDYYPEAYLNRLAHEGVNGLWLSIQWKDITKTSFREPIPDMERRLAKLRRLRNPHLALLERAGGVLLGRRPHAQSASRDGRRGLVRAPLCVPEFRSRPAVHL